MSLKRKQENINKEDVRLYDKSERKICAEKGEYISIVKERERKCIWVYQRIIEKRITQTLKVTSNSTGIFSRKEE